MLKRVTRIHLAVARENVACLPVTDDRRKLAATIRRVRWDFGNADARRWYRTMYGVLLPLEG